MPLQITRPPLTDDELWHWVRAVWGVTIPRTAVCEGHVSPFQAFADAFFARAPVSIWKASRGFGGKSYLLGCLALTEAVALGAQVTVLGGSAQQSQNVHEHTNTFWYSPMAPNDMLESDPTQYRTRLTNGAWIWALMASQKSARGPHPQRLRLDEIDEMDLAILEAAQGQPMDARGLQAQTVMCVAGFTMVTTRRGEIPVVEVTPKDHVLTRGGWRQVRSVTMSGYKPVVDVHLSNGRTLTCTGDHRIATPSGWVIPQDMGIGQEVCGIRTDLVVGQPGYDGAAELGLVSSVLVSTPEPVAGAALPSLAVGADVVGRVGMTLGAVGLGGVDGREGLASQDVLSVGDRLQMVGVDASPVTTQVVEVQPFGDGSNQAEVGPATDRASMDGAVHLGVPPGGASRPHPAPVFVDGRPVQEPVTVVDITARAPHLHLPVYDVEVDGIHEFTAEGIVIHNSSTHQYPDKTMSIMLERAGQKGWPVYHWCFRETSNEVDGWLKPAQVERKRSEISDKMFAIEYDLQEPSFGGRAIETEFVERMFTRERGEWMGDPSEDIVIEEPEPTASYITGVDWAKELDWTVVRTFRSDCHPWREVAFLRVNRKPWPVMVRMVEDRLRRYPGILAHDATGLGDVIDDLIDWPRRKVEPLVLKGRDREAAWTEYIAGIEQGAIVSARIEYPYSEHKYVTHKDLYSTGGHPPDSFVAGAVAWLQRTRRNHPAVKPVSIMRQGGRSPWALDSVSPTRVW